MAPSIPRHYMGQKSTPREELPYPKCPWNEELGYLQRQKTSIHLLSPSHTHCLDHSTHMTSEQPNYKAKEYFEAGAVPLFLGQPLLLCHRPRENCYFHQYFECSTAPCFTESTSRKGSTNTHALQRTTTGSSLLLKCGIKCGFKCGPVEKRMGPHLLWPVYRN